MIDQLKTVGESFYIRFENPIKILNKNSANTLAEYKLLHGGVNA